MLHYRRKKNCLKHKSNLLARNGSFDSWCHVYFLYMHSKVQYINRNTSMNLYPYTHTYSKWNGKGIVYEMFQKCLSFKFGVNVEMFTQTIAQGH